jgi:hypothetical protein
MGTRIVTANRVAFTSTTAGTGTYSVGSAVAGYFHPADAPVTSGSRVVYAALDNPTAPTIIEIGEGVLSSGSPWTLTRARIIRTLNAGVAGSSAINWSAGTRTIFLSPDAASLPLLDTDGWIHTPGDLVLAANGVEAARIDDVTRNMVVGGPLSSTNRLSIYGAGTTSATLSLWSANSVGTNTFFVRDDGLAGFPVIFGSHTTASAANLVMGASGELLRSTSSAEWKRDFEPLDIAHAERVVAALEPVFYRSTSPQDRADWSWYGLIAEDVARLDPRLVQWRPLPDGEEAAPGVPTFLADYAPQPPAEPYTAAWVPAGVAYDRVALLALAVQRARADRLDARLAALEARAC